MSRAGAQVDIEPRDDDVVIAEAAPLPPRAATDVDPEALAAWERRYCAAWPKPERGNFKDDDGNVDQTAYQKAYKLWNWTYNKYKKRLYVPPAPSAAAAAAIADIRLHVQGSVRVADAPELAVVGIVDRVEKERFDLALVDDVLQRVPWKRRRACLQRVDAVQVGVEARVYRRKPPAAFNLAAPVGQARQHCRQHQ